jgi:Mrp family chromosome partitioning ATPase
VSAALERAAKALELPLQALGATLASHRRAVEGPRRIAFTSPRHGVGTTTVAACTALALARDLKRRVALVEANPFRPALAPYAGVAPTPGFAEVLREEVELDRVLGESALPGLSLLPAGELGAPETIDWNGSRARLLFAETLRSFPFALVDLAPLLDRPVARLVLPLVDLAVLVVRAGHTTKADARAAVQALRESGVTVVGVVLNRFRQPLGFL